MERVDRWSALDRSQFSGPVHFSCRGTKRVLKQIPDWFVRERDTASVGIDPKETTIYRYTKNRWEPWRPWSEQASIGCIRAASAVIVVEDPS